MRARIKSMRRQLAQGLAARTKKRDFSFIERQNGMFSYTGLTADQVQRLREEFGIYAVSTGRICVAALNSRNVDYVADSIAKVL
jgi:aromatic-amino-acid transaminase